MQVDLCISQSGPNELWGGSLLNYSLLPQCAEENFGSGAWSTSSFFTDFSAAMLVLLTSSPFLILWLRRKLLSIGTIVLKFYNWKVLIGFCSAEKLISSGSALRNCSPCSCHWPCGLASLSRPAHHSTPLPLQGTEKERLLPLPFCPQHVWLRQARVAGHMVIPATWTLAIPRWPRRLSIPWKNHTQFWFPS